jgi:DNA-binding NarL/FixJ family response regulator
MAGDGLEAIQQARLLQPDIVVMDLLMPRLNGLEATRAICKSDPAAKILIVTNNDDPAVVQAAFTAGARGYVLKSQAAVELLKAVEAIVRGELFISRGLAKA